MKLELLTTVTAMALALTTACGRGSQPSGGPGRVSGVSEPHARSTPVSTNKADYPVFPDADSGADPSVPADQGGKGFTGQGWETNTDFDLIGDPHALKGGLLRDHFRDFPGTLRLLGPEANNSFARVVGLCYETLLGLHPTTLEYIPGLATHWQVSPDKMTYRFRIDPNARFSDGTPVTSEDVVATYDFIMDKTLQDPVEQLAYSKLERPVAEGKYIVRVHAKELNWLNFYHISGMPILPAHVLKGLHGDQFIKDWNYKLLPGSGPYIIRDEDIVKGKSITARRRKDYWAEKARANVGLNNFDAIRYVVIRDENLAFETFKKGELDYFYIYRARQWVQELNFENVQRGLVQKKKIFNSAPQGTQGFAFNARRAPFDDVRMRKAFTLLYDRQRMIEKLMFNQYLPQNSYFAGGPYENPDNPKNTFDPQAAQTLLAQAGWKERNSQGLLVKNGQPLEVEMLYGQQTSEPYLTIYQEDLRKAGITLNLRLITPEQQFQMVNQRKFQMASMAWGPTLLPDPEQEWHSTMADVDNTPNITGFKNARADKILDQYHKMFAVEDRVRALRELDGILANDYRYVLEWYPPYTRLIWWNKLGTPPGYITRTGDYSLVLTMWWIDPAKDAKLQQALRNPSMKLDVGADEDRYWLGYAQKEQVLQPREKGQ